MSIDPTPYQHTVELMLATDGLMVDVWDEYVVTLDMLQAGNPWTFAFWRSDPVSGAITGDRRTTWDLLRRTAKLGDNVLLTIDGAAQLNGRIETMNAGGGRGGVTLVIGGRDLAGPAHGMAAGRVAEHDAAVKRRVDEPGQPGGPDPGSGGHQGQLLPRVICATSR